MCVALELEEDALNPWKYEVEAWTTEERADDHEHCPEHQVNRENTGEEFAILWLV